MRGALAVLAIVGVGAALALPVLGQAPAPIKTGGNAAPEARKVGLPAKVGAWELVRFIPGEHNHFLYAAQKRSFSLFVTETKNTHPLQAQTGWKKVGREGLWSGFIHQDARNPECTAIVFKHATQRRMVMGKLTEAELIGLARLLR